MEDKKLKVILFVGPTDIGDKEVEKYNTTFLRNLEEKLGREIEVVDPKEVAAEEHPLFFIGTGGAEENFQSVFRNFPEPYMLLTTDAYNSLAAAMEIMGYLDMEGKKGEILHGDLEQIAKRIEVTQRVFKVKNELKTKRLGAVGKPSGLISSEADGKKLKEACGMQIVDIDLNELIKEFQSCEIVENKYTKEIREKGYDKQEIDKALKVYAALKNLIVKYQLDAVTIKCFDLLEPLDTTGCLALAILNTEGIPAACEGDTKSLISMTILNMLTDEPVFMANPSFMDTKKNEMIIAHCTLPLHMPKTYELTTHFESGIGVAIAGNVEPGPITIFKCNDDLSQFYVEEAELLECLHREDLCRTQMHIHFKENVNYFLKHPISNHHLICCGSWKEVVEEFFTE